MRKLTDDDLASIIGTTICGYEIEAARVKCGEFSDSDHYGIILGKSADGNYVTWQFHLETDGTVNSYWGHYFTGDRDAALRHYNTRDIGIIKENVWGKYQRYLRDWIDDHNWSSFYGMSPASFDEWFGNKCQASDADGQERGRRDYKVTITETLKLTVDVEAGNRDEAEQLVSDKWRNSEYVLDAGNFVGIEFTTVTDDEQEQDNSH